MPIRISYSGTVSKLRQATDEANNILASNDLITIIRSRTTPFEDSKPATLSPNIVAHEFIHSSLELTLREYRTSSSVGGKFNTGNPRSIWANLNAVPLRTACSLAAMLVHECTHALSYNVPDIDFSHDGQSSNSNQNTAPYWIQGRVKRQFCPSLTKGEMDEIITVDFEEQEEGLSDAIPGKESY